MHVESSTFFGKRIVTRRLGCALAAVLSAVGCASAPTESETDPAPTSISLNAAEEAEVDTATDDAICYCESLWLLTSADRQILEQQR